MTKSECFTPQIGILIIIFHFNIPKKIFFLNKRYCKLYKGVKFLNIWDHFISTTFLWRHDNTPNFSCLGAFFEVTQLTFWFSENHLKINHLIQKLFWQTCKNGHKELDLETSETTLVPHFFSRFSNSDKNDEKLMFYHSNRHIN